MTKKDRLKKQARDEFKARIGKPIDPNVLTGPQACIAKEMETVGLLLKKHDETLSAVIKERMKLIDKKDRFTLPAYTHRISMQRARDCLRFRVWFSNSKDDHTNMFVEVTKLKHAAEVVMDLADQGKVVQCVVGVVWDNASACFAECAIKEWEKLKKEEKTEDAATPA